MKGISVLVILITLLSFINLIYATTWYVHPDSALNTIQSGLDSCANNDSVLVASGTYYENIIWPYIQGIDLVSESGPASTFIDGDGLESVITIPTTVNLDSTSRIDGFTIQNGSSFFGGGIYCRVSSGTPIITNNVITANSATLGGGIASSDFARPFIISNTIIGNSANVAGGIFCFSDSPAIIDNNITLNTSTGIDIEDESSPTITGNTISNNSGLGICIDELCAPSISDNIITNNGSHGILATDASPTIHNCVITNNSGDGILYTYGMKRSGSRALTVSFSDIFDNLGYGVKNTDSTLTISAENNWWGDSTGPGGLGPGSGDEVSDWVDYEPWLFVPFGIEEHYVTKPIETSAIIRSAIFRGPLHLPEGKNCKVFDITGRIVAPDNIQPGIYFIEVDGVVTQKVVKVR
jgi:parallel beta-helix repeat protein